MSKPGRPNPGPPVAVILKFMNEIKSALKILGLDETATLEEAKAAFKKMAKRHHPDRAGLAPGIPRDDARMKEINVAYTTVKTFLKKASEKKVSTIPGNKKASGKLSTGWHVLARSVKQWMFPPGMPSSSPRPTSPPSPGKRPGNRTPSPRPVQFETLLKQSIARRLSHKEESPPRKVDAPSVNRAYMRYVALKKKMHQRRSMSYLDDNAITEVRPVSRVDRIKP